MTARTDRKNRMAAAAAARTAPEARPAGQTAIRTKPVRITVDLDPVTYTALHKWLADAAEVGEPRITLSDAVRALIGELVDGSPNLTTRVRARIWAEKR
jgi:hypothetical protein